MFRASIGTAHLVGVFISVILVIFPGAIESIVVVLEVV
jgi:hypothetical protein